MKNRDRQIHQMLTSVVAFEERNVSVFSKSSSKVQKEFGSGVEMLNGILADYEAAEGALPAVRQNRELAYQGLKTELEDVTQLVAALNHDTFRMPAGTSMSKLINKARAFLQIAPSMKPDFIEHGFPADFAAQLEAKVDRLAKCIEDFKEVRGRKVAANRRWQALLAEVLNTLARLDLVIRHAIAGNLEAQAQYDVARTVRRTPSRKEEEQAAPASPVGTQAQQPSPPRAIATAAA